MIKGVKQRLLMVTIVYWVLLSYMVAALVWWFIALQNQNSLMSNMRLADISKSDAQYSQKIAQVNAERKRKVAQYIGEGATFLVLISIGAVFIFRVTRKQIVFSQQQQNFMMAITHELKTPIAITQLNLETLQKRKLEQSKQDMLIQNTLQEANRLNTLCNNILFAAQIDAGAYKPTSEELDWSSIVNQSANEFVRRYSKRNIELSISDGLFILGEQLQLQMLINNLIENALKYSPVDAQVTIKLFEKNDKAIVEVIDEGSGIPDNEKKQVFEKFYRSGDEKLRNTKGTGLGLYLCKKIVAGHKGFITITNNQPKGSIFTVSLNIYHEPK
jgi:K+-sensing histidine kinase KdpD